MGMVGGGSSPRTKGGEDVMRNSFNARSAAWVAAAVGLALGLHALSSAAAESYRIYVANEYGADITVIDTATDEVISTIPISGRPGVVRPRGMAVSPDG